MPKKSVKKTTKKKGVVNTAAVPVQGSCFEDVRHILAEARRRAYSAVNFVMVEAYWKIGRRIVEEEQGGNERAEYGSFLIRELSRRLGDEFGKGFSVANLRNFRQFFLMFPDVEIPYTVSRESAESAPQNRDSQKRYALRRELSWTHYRLIMRVENPAARAFYVREAAEQNWSTRQLERNIRTFDFERRLNAPEKRAATPNIPDRANIGVEIGDFIKDPYVLEFLGLSEPWEGHESILETMIMDACSNFSSNLARDFRL